ncbi:MAG: ATP-binding protein [Candidatus Izimaplasma sp.]|nr:ATP-binding protein [Candidatus Izimaplasma bacterium]
MKKLLFLSGKGGTGKTIIASSFIKLAKSENFADCDVEAPNLHLIYKKGQINSKPYYGLKIAKINADKCVNCGICYDNCRFGAIDLNDSNHQINPYKCEGCGVCGFVCPQGAIDFVDSISGSIDLYKDNYLFSTGSLKMGSGNSGLLVTEVKKQLDNHYEKITIIDGPPGIGCPVIASISGVDFVLLVSEPSYSGFSDLKRIIETINKFKIDFGVCINKYDLNIEISKEIKAYLNKQNYNFLGDISYSEKVSEIINNNEVVVDYDFVVGKEIKNIYLNTMALLDW